jgi:hypothetical protein
LQLGELRRAAAPGVFATLPVTYAAPAAVARACAIDCFAELPETKGQITFPLDGKILCVAMPIAMQTYATPD